MPQGSRTDTCTAGAGSLLVEFGVLSRLIGDPVYELSARRANRVLWELRNADTGLLGKHCYVCIRAGKLPEKFTHYSSVPNISVKVL